LIARAVCIPTKILWYSRTVSVETGIPLMCDAVHRKEEKKRKFPAGKAEI
jgi:hypothetical protein